MCIRDSYEYSGKLCLFWCHAYTDGLWFLGVEFYFGTIGHCYDSLPSGGYAWNVEDDDTKNVRLIDGLWTISQRDKLIYTQKGGS